jgi:hypothetical protein
MGEIMKQYNRSNITEEPIIDADQSWKLRYLDQLKESRETGKPLSEVINACYDRNAGDPYADYGDNTYFINIRIGKWDKPHKNMYAWRAP